MEEDQRSRQAKIQEQAKALTTAAMKLHDLMEFGQSLIVSLVIQPKIITPGQQPEVKTMIITKPSAMLSIAPETPPPPGMGN